MRLTELSKIECKRSGWQDYPRASWGKVIAHMFDPCILLVMANSPYRP